MAFMTYKNAQKFIVDTPFGVGSQKIRQVGKQFAPYQPNHSKGAMRLKTMRH